MRWILVTIILFAVLGCGVGLTSRSDSNSSSKERVNDKSSNSLDGVYEFVSRTTTVDAPDKSTERLSAPEWFGLWIFHNGYFSQTRMMNIRPDVKYQFENETLTLTWQLIPGPESRARGQRVVVLRKIKQ